MARQRVRRLRQMAGIGVDRVGQLADRAADADILRLENLDTDLRPAPGVIEATRQAAALDVANSYLPFFGFDRLRQAAADRVSRASGIDYPWQRSTVICAGGLTGILNVLLATLEPGDEVIVPDPIYIGLLNRIRLAGGVPVFLPCEVVDGVWKLDTSRLDSLLSPMTRAFLMMSPTMPSGAVFDRHDWAALTAACSASDAWMIYNSAMEGILFDGLEAIHPASFPDMAQRTITVGSVAKECRMIGWRVGWIVAPPDITDDIGLVNISNVVANVGIAQEAAIVALDAPADDLRAANAVWQDRRDVIADELRGYPIVQPQGGWSLLFDVAALGWSGPEAARRLLKLGKIAATPMTGWGTPRSDDYVRLVFSNEPVQRLRGLRQRVEAALGPAADGSG